MKILVVDDEPMLCELLQEELEYEGYTVSTAGSVAEAWALIEVQNFNVILTDIRMPRETGVELLRRVRVKFPEEPKVYLVSGFSDVTEEEAYALGANGMLSKPYSIAQLLRTIESQGIPVSLGQK